MYNVSFHLTDKCNIRCKDCHWFSQPIIEKQEIHYNEYIKWIKKHKSQIRSIRITGGEPTIYRYFIELINNIPSDIPVNIFSNGTNINILKEINREYYLFISMNRNVSVDFKQKVLSINPATRILSYNSDEANLQNQLETDHLKHLVGKKCECKSSLIRFASDGKVYNCEVGLRSKDDFYYTGLSLWEGNLKLDYMDCQIKNECLSNLINENIYNLK